MHQQKRKVCGIDVHKRFFIATTHSQEGESKTRRFEHDLNGLVALKEWVLSEGCEQVAVESTGVYWYPLFSMLEDTIEVIVANAHHIKHIPGRKTDTIDSRWIAELALNGLIQPSRIFPRNDRELRELTRNREKLTRIRTQLKNRVHQVLDATCITLSSVLSNVFGKSGVHILQGLLQGRPMDEIMAGIPSKQVARKEADIRGAIKSRQSDAQIAVIQQSLDLIQEIDAKIQETDHRIIDRYQDPRGSPDRHIGSGNRINGGGYHPSEIGNLRDFSSPEKLASWCGLVPSVYQSAETMRTGAITKQGSKHLRWILTEVAHAAARTKNNRLKRFFLRVKARSGFNKAVIALARKMVGILWHLLIRKEYFDDEESGVLKCVSPHLKVDSPTPRSIQEAIEILVKAHYTVTRGDPVLPGPCHWRG